MRIVSFLACEDIRREMGGKVTLVGSFDGLSIDGDAVSEWPTAVRVAAHLRFIPEPGEPHPDENVLRITFNQHEVANGTTKLNAPTPERPSTLATPTLFIPIDGPGNIVFEYTFRAAGHQVGGVYVFTIPVEVKGKLPPKSAEPA